MDQIIEALLRRFSHKGVSPDKVPCVIRDVLHAVCEVGEPATDAVNRRLAMLGWDEEILDEVSFALIICLAQEGDEARAQQHT